MNQILLDFEKLFATIKNDKNNFNHLSTISNMIDVFEAKYKQNYSVATRVSILFLRKQFKLLELKLNNIA